MTSKKRDLKNVIKNKKVTIEKLSDLTRTLMDRENKHHIPEVHSFFDKLNDHLDTTTSNNKEVLGAKGKGTNMTNTTIKAIDMQRIIKSLFILKLASFSRCIRILEMIFRFFG